MERSVCDLVLNSLHVSPSSSAVGSVGSIFLKNRSLSPSYLSRKARESAAHRSIRWLAARLSLDRLAAFVIVAG